MRSFPKVFGPTLALVVLGAQEWLMRAKIIHSNYSLKTVL
jgi:hypothetical protein